MNVLILSDLIAYSGVGQYMIQLGRAIADSSCNTVVLASPHVIRTDIPGTITVVKLNSPKKVIKYLLQLRDIIAIRVI